MYFMTSNSEFLITKRTTCDKCTDGDQSFAHVDTPDVIVVVVKCTYCKGLGYTDEMVDADEWLLERLKVLCIPRAEPMFGLGTKEQLGFSRT